MTTTQTQSERKPSPFKNRTRTCPFVEGGTAVPSYKNPKLLFRYISERGRILPRRITGVSAKMQRMLKKSIKMARMLALLPFSNS